MNKIILLIAILILNLTSCAPTTANTDVATAQELNLLSRQRFGIGMEALSYLISGQRTVRLEDQRMLIVFKEDAPIAELQAAGLVTVDSSSSDKGYVVIERTSAGDRVHDLFSPPVAP